MFYGLLFIFILIALIPIHFLRSIQKNAMTQLQIIKYQKRVMDYLRSEDPSLTTEDYNKLRDMLAMNDKLMNHHVCKRSSLLHSWQFLQFTKAIVRKSYAMDKIVSEYKSENKHVIEAKENLDRLITWSLFYNTPFVVKMLVLFSLVIKLISLQFELSRERLSKDMYAWFSNIVLSYSKEDAVKRWHLILDFFHIRSTYDRFRLN